MLKARSRLGKYRILHRIAQGGFAIVYRARDTIEGVDVALKVPKKQFTHKADLEELQREVRMTTRLEHPNILPVKNASVIDGTFVIAYPLGAETLAERLSRRLSAETALSYAGQLIDAIAFAHERRVIHCDIKPDNIILYHDGHLRLGDFGIAKVAMARATLASGQGTIGYIAPEQAMGKPSCRSDIFSVGLVMWRMFCGERPVWPYSWPPPGIDRAKRKLHPDFIDLIRRCIEIDERKRFANGNALKKAFARIRPRALTSDRRRKSTRRSLAPSANGTPSPAWRSVRTREFTRRYGRLLETRAQCSKCHAPISESMQHCPWCATRIDKYRGPARFKSSCGRCGRSAKPDFRFCAYCYGPAIAEPSARSYSDRRYTSRCGSCRTPLMPFMRYCPGCRRKTKQAWGKGELPNRCKGCGWGVINEFWDHCPWCGVTVGVKK